VVASLIIWVSILRLFGFSRSIVIVVLYPCSSVPQVAYFTS